MSVATVIPYAPISVTAVKRAFLPRLESLNIVSSKFPSAGSFSSDEFVSRLPVSGYKGVWNRNPMTQSITTSAFRGGTGDEEAEALEQESFISDSSEFRPNFTAAALQSKLNHLSKWFMTALFGSVLLWRHDGESVWAVMGSVINSGLSTILKHIFNQKRPVSTLRSDPGMPSSHAQSIFFTVMFAIFSLVEWLGINGLTLTLSGLTVVLGSYLSWLRVSQQFHTISQVVAGAVLGSIFSILWLWCWDAIVADAFYSYFWVRVIILLAAVGFCMGFLLYIIRYWIMDKGKNSEIP